MKNTKRTLRIVTNTAIVAFGVTATLTAGYIWGSVDMAKIADEELVKVKHTAYTKEQNAEALRLVLSAKNKQLTESLATKTKQLDELHSSIEHNTAARVWHIEEGARITAYSPLDDQNGINSEGLGTTTSIGMRVGVGRFAVDPKRIPYGSEILIVYPDGSTEEGIAADTGGALRKPGKIKIDVFRYTFAEAMAFSHKEAIVLWKPMK